MPESIQTDENGTKPIRRDELGRVLPGSAPLNPNGRPKGFERRIRERLGEEGFDTFADKLVQLVEKWKPEQGEGVPEDVAWLLDRVYPKTQRHEVDAQVTDQRVSPEIPDDAETLTAVADNLRELVSSNDTEGDTVQ